MLEAIVDCLNADTAQHDSKESFKGHNNQLWVLTATFAIWTQLKIDQQANLLAGYA